MILFGSKVGRLWRLGGPVQLKLFLSSQAQVDLCRPESISNWLNLVLRWSKITNSGFIQTRRKYFNITHDIPTKYSRMKVKQLTWPALRMCTSRNVSCCAVLCEGNTHPLFPLLVNLKTSGFPPLTMTDIPSVVKVLAAGHHYLNQISKPSCH